MVAMYLLSGEGSSFMRGRNQDPFHWIQLPSGHYEQAMSSIRRVGSSPIIRIGAYLAFAVWILRQVLPSHACLPFPAIPPIRGPRPPVE